MALPSCPKTTRVAEAVAELCDGTRWSKKVHVFCGDRQRMVVRTVLMIMKRRRRGVLGEARSDGDDEEEGGQDQQGTPGMDPNDHVRLLPRHMQSAPDDVWWKVLEMVGIMW